VTEPQQPIDRYLPKLGESAARWVRFLGVLLAIAVLTWVVIRLRVVFTPLAVALAIAYILNPVVTRLEAFQVRRVTSVSAGVAAIVGFSAIGLLAGGAQVIVLAQNIPGYVNSTQRWIAHTMPLLVGPVHAGTGQFAASAPTTAEAVSLDEAPPAAGPTTPDLPLSRDAIASFVSRHGATAAQTILTWIGQLLSNVTYLATVTVLIPFYAFFFLLHFNQIVQTVRDHLPSAYRPTVVRVVSTIDRAVADFFRGRLVVCLIVGVLNAAGWWLVGVPYSLPLGALAGALNLVPYVGILALPPALLVAYIEHQQQGWVLAVVLTMSVFMLVQALESFVLSPYITSKYSGLHTVTTVVALLIGAEVAGLLGVLLSIPIASTLKWLAAEYVLPEIRRLAANAASPPADASSGASPPGGAGGSSVAPEPAAAGTAPEVRK
jgi:predicted PurR-regulated permease PerM